MPRVDTDRADPADSSVRSAGRSSREAPLFRRSSTAAEKSTPSPAEEVAADEAVRPAGKGRPTPSRREAEAAARARAKPARTRKEINAKAREDRVARQNKVREAMRTGDDRFMPARDRGPRKRFVRDLVDTRFGFTELTLPLMVVSLVLQYTGNDNLRSTGVLIFTILFVLIFLDLTWLRFRLRKEARKRLEDPSSKGLMFYALTRSMQIKPLRLPKPQLKIGQPMADSYR
ncbi:MAG TPA: DUF3043 domain-containing protein [Nocardioides sp.]